MPAATSNSSTVVFAEIPGRKAIGTAASMMVAANGWNMISVSTVDQAIAAMNNSRDIRLLVCNDPSQEIFETARAHPNSVTTILVTDLPMQEYSQSLAQKDIDLLDHVIANFDLEWTSADLAITLQKLIRQDLFGLEKYLSPEAKIQARVVKGSADRDSINKSVQEWVESCGVGKNIPRLAYGICEELLMNAIYDAPVAGGRTHYELMERNSKRELAADEWATLKFGMDHRIFAISIADPFGAFLREKWFSYLRKALRRNDSENLIDTKKGGAGLGLFKMLYSSHGVVCNVSPGHLTEVIILISINHPVRDFIHMPRSIHYFRT